MRYAYILAGLVLAIAASACGGHVPGAPSGATGLELAPLYGTTPGALELSRDGQRVTVSFSLEAGRSGFAQLDLPAGLTAGPVQWTGLTDSAGAALALSVALPNEGGVELGVCPLPGAPAIVARLDLALTPGPRTISVAPSGPANEIADLSTATYAPGQVILGWTQTNAGDLDLNGEVNASDLAAIARNYGASYDAADPFKINRPLYWVDGDGNGEVNSADVTAIGQHYRSTVSGYLIKRNGTALPGASPGSPTITPAAGTQLPGLPRRYGIIVDGATTDSWQVTAVDSGGVEGIGSNGVTETTDLVATLSLNGVQLFDLAGGQAGPLGPGKFSSRVISPIEIVNGYKLSQPLGISGTTAVYSNLPKLQTILLYFNYSPAVDLATGLPKQASGTRSASAVVDNLVNTAIPLQLPAAAGPTHVDAAIDLVENPSGGYFLELTATVTAPGSPATTTKTRLDYAAGSLNRDTDDDGEYDDEATFTDDNKDCVSNSLLEKELDDSEYGDAARQDARMVATVEAIDQETGNLTLSDMTLFEGELELPVPPLVLRFSESTEYEDGLAPTSMQPGSRLEVHFYVLSNPAGGQPDIYWAKSLGLQSNSDFVFLDASDSRKEEIRVRWGIVPGYQSFTLKRLSPRQPNGNYEVDWEEVFSTQDEPEFTDVQVTAGVEYHYVYYGFNGADLIELDHDAGVAEPS